MFCLENLLPKTFIDYRHSIKWGSQINSHEAVLVMRFQSYFQGFDCGVYMSIHFFLPSVFSITSAVHIL